MPIFLRLFGFVFILFKISNSEGSKHDQVSRKEIEQSYAIYLHKPNKDIHSFGKAEGVMERSSYVYTTSKMMVDFLLNFGYKVLDTECYVFTDPAAIPDLVPVYRYNTPTQINALISTYPRIIHTYSPDTYYTTKKSDELLKKGYKYGGIDFYVRKPKVYLGEKPKEKDKWGTLYRMWSDKESVLNHYYTRVEVRTKRKNRGYRDDGALGGVILKPGSSPIFSKATPLYKLVRHF